MSYFSSEPLPLPEAKNLPNMRFCSFNTSNMTYLFCFFSFFINHPIKTRISCKRLRYNWKQPWIHKINAKLYPHRKQQRNEFIYDHVTIQFFVQPYETFSSFIESDRLEVKSQWLTLNISQTNHELKCTSKEEWLHCRVAVYVV